MDRRLAGGWRVDGCVDRQLAGRWKVDGCVDRRLAGGWKVDGCEWPGLQWPHFSVVNDSFFQAELVLSSMVGEISRQETPWDGKGPVHGGEAQRDPRAEFPK